MKTCKRCGLSLSIDNFTRQYDKKYDKYYLASNCKKCKSEWQREYRSLNPERYKSANNKTVLKKHGLSLEEFETLLKDQNGVCAICKKLPTRGRLHVDHNHKCCEKFACDKCRRGLLCQSCNGALGLVSDNIQTLLSMVEYIKQWEIDDKDLATAG